MSSYDAGEVGNSFGPLGLWVASTNLPGSRWLQDAKVGVVEGSL
jgi:hypothetical protein